MRPTEPSSLHVHESGHAELVAAGDPVEVWCRSLGRWSSGFVAVDLGADGWRVLRRSDRSPLPVRFCVDDVRPVPVARRPR